MNTHLEESVGNGSITERIFRRYERGISGDVPMITGVVPYVSASGAIQRFLYRKTIRGEKINMERVKRRCRQYRE